MQCHSLKRANRLLNLVIGGARKGDKGCFIEPTIFLNPALDSPIYKVEIFGPVLVVKTFKTEEEVIEMANNTTYGLVCESKSLFNLESTTYLSF